MEKDRISGKTFSLDDIHGNEDDFNRDTLTITLMLKNLRVFSSQKTTCDRVKTYSFCVGSRNQSSSTNVKPAISIIKGMEKNSKRFGDDCSISNRTKAETVPDKTIESEG